MATSVFSAIDSAAGEIRLLTISPSESQEDVLICHLAPALLSSLPQYEALSYTWGKPNVFSDIQLNGQPFPVQENAAAALRRLRHEKTPRTVWVDAICINQMDVREKEGQLPLMRRIYEQSEQVCVWLGEPTESTELAIQELQSELGVDFVATGGKSLVNNYLASLLAPSHPLRNISSGVAWQWFGQLENELQKGDLRELMSRPWWSRVWIIQEAVVGKKIIFMVGGDSFPWGAIEKALSRIRNGTVGLSITTTVTVFGTVANPETYSANDRTYQLISRLRSAWHAGSVQISIYELLYEFRHLECTNQRDRVFGWLGLARAGGHFEDIAPDYTSSTRDVFMKSALSIIGDTGTLDILNCVREWRGVQKPPNQAYAFSLPDQAKYHDVGAMVSDGPGTNSRRGWARLPEGWERIPRNEQRLGGFTMLKTMWKGQSARYYDHNTNTTHEESPLEGKEPPVCRHVALQREVPPGWVKTWDNLGRATIKYDPARTSSSSPPQDLDTSDLLDSLPSWVPNFSAITHLDPHPFLDWSDTNPLYNACASTPATAVPNFNNKTLTVEGIHFDTILAISSPWHPTSPIISRRAAPILSTWETLALNTSLFSPHPCPYHSSLLEGRKEALWRTHLASSPTQPLADATKLRPLMEAWYDRTSWATHLPALEETASQTLWEGISAEVDVGKQHWDLHAELRRQEGYDFDTSGVDGLYAELIKRIQAVCAHRALFVTRRGYMGLAPWNARVGDAVCVLKGGKTPFLLREKNEGLYSLVGEAFVQGIMGGEVMKGDLVMMRLFCLI
ncbi:heterokaryon incompatibility protein-domain-containing protein [Immersiella caudata]|uniref:Heterokaryon incompatibility protein-domain-containing protein n=1 Tax=Immersiella caudata TaxID=314043 RepID=A0AA40C3R6_9PEZI|nr:heterokaryon incompatibility protein-domain-containing protein [Immersiella caudata]